MPRLRLRLAGELPQRLERLGVRAQALEDDRAVEPRDAQLLRRPGGVRVFVGQCLGGREPVERGSVAAGADRERREVRQHDRFLLRVGELAIDRERLPVGRLRLGGLAQVLQGEREVVERQSERTPVAELAPDPLGLPAFDQRVRELAPVVAQHAGGVAGAGDLARVALRVGGDLAVRGERLFVTPVEVEGDRLVERRPDRSRGGDGDERRDEERHGDSQPRDPTRVSECQGRRAEGPGPGERLRDPAGVGL